MANDIKSLKWLKERLTELEATLQEGQLATVANYRPEGRKPIKLMISHRLRKQCKKGKVWKSKAMLTALKNASYGFDLTTPGAPADMTASSCSRVITNRRTR